MKIDFKKLSTSRGYHTLKQSVIEDCMKGEGCFSITGCTKTDPNVHNRHTIKCFHQYCDKFKWIIDRAKHYSHKTGVSIEKILDAWEENRTYWYMNYYQESAQPKINKKDVLIVESLEEFFKKVRDLGFRCPACSGISNNPYRCTSGNKLKDGKTCNWRVYGLLGHLGKGLYVFVKDRATGHTIFMPVALEK